MFGVFTNIIKSGGNMNMVINLVESQNEWNSLVNTVSMLYYSDPSIVHNTSDW